MSSIKGAIVGLTPLQKRSKSALAQTMKQTPEMWLGVGALCVIGRNADLVDTVSVLRKAEEVKYCSNHDDGETEASFVCRDCKPYHTTTAEGKMSEETNAMYFCGECDRVLHLSRATRNHRRSSIVTEGIIVDVHEVCARAKVGEFLWTVRSFLTTSCRRCQQ